MRAAAAPGLPEPFGHAVALAPDASPCAWGLSAFLSRRAPIASPPRLRQPAVDASDGHGGIRFEGKGQSVPTGVPVQQQVLLSPRRRPGERTTRVEAILQPCTSLPLSPSRSWRR